MSTVFVPLPSLIAGLEDGVKNQLSFIRESPSVKKELADGARGYIFDLKTGLLLKMTEQWHDQVLKNRREGKSWPFCNAV